MKTLEELNLQYCDLRNRLGYLTPLQHLKVLDLSFTTHLSSIDFTVLSEFKELITLELRSPIFISLHEYIEKRPSPRGEKVITIPMMVYWDDFETIFLPKIKYLKNLRSIGYYGEDIYDNRNIIQLLEENGITELSYSKQ